MSEKRKIIQIATTRDGDLSWGLDNYGTVWLAKTERESGNLVWKCVVNSPEVDDE